MLKSVLACRGSRVVSCRLVSRSMISRGMGARDTARGIVGCSGERGRKLPAKKAKVEAKDVERSGIELAGGTAARVQDGVGAVPAASGIPAYACRLLLSASARTEIGCIMDGMDDGLIICHGCM